MAKTGLVETWKNSPTIKMPRYNCKICGRSISPFTVVNHKNMRLCRICFRRFYTKKNRW